MLRGNDSDEAWALAAAGVNGYDEWLLLVPVSARPDMLRGNGSDETWAAAIPGVNEDDAGLAGM
jgi:hypothetical protein